MRCAGLPPRVLVRTYARAPIERWDDALSAYAPETIERLADLGVRLVGIDTASIDPPTARRSTSHQAIRRARPARAREPGARRRARGRLRADRAAAEAGRRRRLAGAGGAAGAVMTDRATTARRARCRRSAGAAARAVRAADARASSTSTATRSARCPRPPPARVQQVVQRRMGPRPDRAAGTAPAGSTCRSASATRSRGWSAPAPGELVGGRFDLGQRVQGAERGAGAAQADAPQRRGSSRERSNFPTDLYIAEALAREHGFELRAGRRPTRSRRARRRRSRC